MEEARDRGMPTAREALERLMEGNRRFVAGEHRYQGDTPSSRRRELIGGQQPFAVILGCSDSRVPVELVFDQGLGDLFVIRVAGNVVAASQIGSIEYAAEMFGTRLVVVLGHTLCGAIQATINQLMQPKENQSPNLRSIVDRIRPAIETLLETELRNDPPALARKATRANVRMSTQALRTTSPVLEALIQDDGLLIVGAEYNLESGVVEFFERPTT